MEETSLSLIQSFDFNDIQLNLFSYGLGMVRYNSILIWKDDKIIIPIGQGIAVYNLNTLKREALIQTNNNIIFCLLQNKRFLFAISYNGDTTILDKLNLQIIINLKNIGRCVRHASVNESYLIICAEKYNEQFKGVTNIYDLNNLQQNPKEVKLINKLSGSYRYGELITDQQLIILKENILQIEQNEKQQQENKKIIDQKNKQKQNKQKNYFLQKINVLNNEQIKEQFHLPYVSEIIGAFNNNNGIICYIYVDRRILIFNGYDYQQLYFGQIEGQGSIYSATFSNNILTLCPQNNYLLNITINENTKLPDILPYKQEIKSDFYELIFLKFSGLQQTNYFIKWLNQFQQILYYNDSGLHIFDFKNVKKQINNDYITFCGLAHNKQGSLVAVGSLIGDILIFSTNQHIERDPIYQTNVMNSVRSLAWSPNEKYIIIGCMNGNIVSWNYEDQYSEPKIILTIEGTVTSLKFFTDNQSKLLITSTTGVLYIGYYNDQTQTIDLFIQHHAHLPQQPTNNQLFGSLHIQADIWNSCISCSNNNLLATCSEDQTSCIWEVQQNNQVKLIQKLTGHQLAVTCVDWQKMDQRIGEIYASISDDQSIKIYSPNQNFKLLLEIKTSFIKEWHTLTYMCLEKLGTRMAICAQNGYFFIFDILDKKFLYAEKIHMGGIEGCIWINNKIITCSSDMCINIIYL